MFDRIIDVIIDFIELGKFFVYIDEFDRGVIMRAGKYNRPAEPGICFIWPLGVEEVFTVNVKPEPMYLDVQSLHTADDYICNIQIGLIWRVVDPKAFIVDNEDTGGIIGMLASGIVADAVEEHKWAEVKTPDWRKALKAPINRKARKRGVEIDEVVKQDFAAGTAGRIWHEGIAMDLDIS